MIYFLNIESKGIYNFSDVPGKATILEIETTSYDKVSGEALCMNRSVTVDDCKCKLDLMNLYEYTV